MVSGDGIEPWDVLDALAGLVAKSMVNIDDSAEGEARYRMLETLRTYARDRLDELGESDQWRQRHAQHYADVADRVGPELLSRDEFAARRRFRVELDNTRAAVTWALDVDDPSAQELGVRIVLALGYEVTMDRRAGTGLWAEHALRRVEAWPPASRVGVVSIAAMSACARADFQTASAWVDEGFDIGVSVDTPVALMLWIARANVLLAGGRFDEAMECMASATSPRRLAPAEASSSRCAGKKSTSHVVASASRARLSKDPGASSSRRPRRDAHTKSPSTPGPTRPWPTTEHTSVPPRTRSCSVMTPTARHRGNPTG